LVWRGAGTRGYTPGPSRSPTSHQPDKSHEPDHSDEPDEAGKSDAKLGESHAFTERRASDAPDESYEFGQLALTAALQIIDSL
jgi:hypothetical protein